MEQPTNPNAPDNIKSNTRWERDEALELWKYFGGVGAQDKNTMVTVVSWLLGVSAALMGYIVTNLPLSVTQPFKGISLALFGVVISIVAGCVSLIYAGYSNWNWAQADAIARDTAQSDEKWKKFLTEESKANLQKWTSGKRSFYATVMKWGWPCLPEKKLAPIFWIYIGLAVFAALTHLVVLSCQYGAC